MPAATNVEVFNGFSWMSPLIAADPPLTTSALLLQHALSNSKVSTFWTLSDCPLPTVIELCVRKLAKSAIVPEPLMGPVMVTASAPEPWIVPPFSVVAPAPAKVKAFAVPPVKARVPPVRLIAPVLALAVELPARRSSASVPPAPTLATPLAFTCNTGTTVASPSVSVCPLMPSVDVFAPDVAPSDSESTLGLRSRVTVSAPPEFTVAW